MKKLLIVFLMLFTIIIKGQTTCENNSFLLEPGETYVISAWAKQETTAQLKSYPDPQISFTIIAGSQESAVVFLTSGPIIEGWQRIEGSFKLPSDISLFELNLHSGSTACYYDDIRISPFNSNLKSFVYDPETQRLTAELDENNYATFYEYDKEGDHGRGNP